MGCDCKIYLPCDARIRDVASVMAIAAGAKFEKRELSNGNGHWYVYAHGVVLETQSTFLVSCPHIVLDFVSVDGISRHLVMFHYEADGTHGKYRLLMPKSTAFWLAIGDRLTRFFGGYVDDNDCDEVKVNWRHKKPREWNDPGTDEPWMKLQEDMLAVKPVTIQDFNFFASRAAYGHVKGVEAYNGGYPLPAGSSKKGASVDSQTEESIMVDIVNNIEEQA